jgi:hypothetical protein
VQVHEAACEGHSYDLSAFTHRLPAWLFIVAIQVSAGIE